MVNMDTLLLDQTSRLARRPARFVRRWTAHPAWPSAETDARLDDPSRESRRARHRIFEGNRCRAAYRRQRRTDSRDGGRGELLTGVWAALGQPFSVLDLHDDPLSPHRFGRFWHRLGGRLQRYQVAGRRRGRRALLTEWTATTRTLQRRIRCSPPRSASGDMRPRMAHLRQFARSASHPVDAASQNISLGGERLLRSRSRPPIKMLFGHKPHALSPGQSVWCGVRRGPRNHGHSARRVGGRAGRCRGPRTNRKRASSKVSGAVGVINRSDSPVGVRHRPSIPHWTTRYIDSVKKFGKAIWDALGRKKRGRSTWCSSIPVGTGFACLSTASGEALAALVGLLRGDERIRPDLATHAYVTGCAEAHPRQLFQQSGREARSGPTRLVVSVPHQTHTLSPKVFPKWRRLPRPYAKIRRQPASARQQLGRAGARPRRRTSGDDLDAALPPRSNATPLLVTTLCGQLGRFRGPDPPSSAPVGTGFPGGASCASTCRDFLNSGQSAIRRNAP